MGRRSIAREQVRLGMYVHAFEGSWLDHPFWRAKFCIASPDQLARVRDSGIDRLIIDEDLGVALDVPGPADVDPVEACDEPAAGVPAADLPAADLAVVPVALVPPAPLVSPQPVARTAAAPADHASPATGRGGDERTRIARALSQATRGVRTLLDGVRLGEGVDTAAASTVVDQLARSLDRNAQAVIGLTRLKKKDEYTYVHSLAVAALMMNLGRHLGLSKDAVNELGVAGVLHDVGKMIVPDLILKKPAQLTDQEFSLTRTHPEQGYRILRDSGGVSQVVLDVCRHHHERYDGKGYPMKLAGEDISLPARIAAVCDVYDAITSERPYKSAWSPAEAITRMYDWRGHFDPAILIMFMRSIGVYPPGMLVRMRSGRLGIILDNGRRASRPVVRTFFCTLDRIRIPIEDVVIDGTVSADQIVTDERAADWKIDDWDSVAAGLMGRPLGQVEPGFAPDRVGHPAAFAASA